MTRGKTSIALLRDGGGVLPKRKIFSPLFFPLILMVTDDDVGRTTFTTLRCPNEDLITWSRGPSCLRWRCWCSFIFHLRDKLLVEVFSMWTRMLLEVPNVDTRISNLPSSPSGCVINLAFSIVESHNLWERNEEEERRFRESVGIRIRVPSSTSPRRGKQIRQK